MSRYVRVQCNVVYRAHMCWIICIFAVLLTGSSDGAQYITAPSMTCMRVKTLSKVPSAQKCAY